MENGSRTARWPIVIVFIFATVAIIGLAQLIYGLADTTKVMVAKGDIAAYSFVGPDDLASSDVARGSVNSDDLTEDEFSNLGESFVTSSAVLSGQRIDSRNVIDGDVSFGGVLPDERIVAATSTVAGAAVGTIQAGDVVDIGGGDGQGLSDYAKVLCIAASASGCSNVVPAGTDINAGDEESGSSRDQTVILLLAVRDGDAGTVAGQEVVLSLNPFCRVDSEGFFVSPRGDKGEAFICRVPADRLASLGDSPANSDPSANDLGANPGPAADASATDPTGVAGQ